MNQFPHIPFANWCKIIFYAILAWASFIVVGWFTYFCAIHLSPYILMVRGIVWWLYGTGEPPL